MARTGQLSFLGRVFVSAIARRVAYVVVALILSALGVGTARAADTAGVAYSKCMGDAAMFLPKDTNLITKAGTCPLKTAPNGGKFYQCQYEAAAYYQGPVSIVTCGDYAFDSDNNECSKKPDYNGAFPGTSGPPKSGSVQCNSGCMQLWTPNGDGTWNGTYAVNATCSMDDDSPDQCKNMGLSKGYHVNNANGMCEPDTQECPDGKQNNAKGECEDQSCPKGMTLTQLGTCENERNECPAGQIKSPTGSCLPGEGQCAQGEAMGKDGTCKRDADGDGKPDEGEEDDDSDNKATFGGGDSCDSPPSCSGDVIMCGQARIQWRIDCNTRRDVNIQGGTCTSPPVCAGKNCKAMEYAQLLAQWRSACAAEKLLAKDAVSGDGKQPEWTKVGGMSQDPGAGSSADDTKVLTTKKISTDDLDQSGFGGGGSCPGFEAASGGVIATAYSATFASPPPMWCTYIARLRAGLIAVSACVSVFILARGVG